MTDPIVVTGATGLVGRAFVRRAGPAVVLSRSPERTAAGLAELAGVRRHGWQPELEPAPAAALGGARAVVHLAGEPVAEGRWDAAKKARIRSSRELGTRNLVAGLAQLSPADRPPVLVCASAVGFYGSRGNDELTEAAAPGTGFLPEVCLAWEREAAAVEALGIRLVRARIGIVLARDGGALAKMLLPFRLGLGGSLAGGEQWMPWVHLDDVVAMLEHAIETPTLSGPMNITAPQPVTNATFTAALADTLGRPAVIPVPKLALRVLFGELSDVLLASQRVLPHVALSHGYAFQYAELCTALHALLRAPSDEKVGDPCESP